jgi:hypothetical protein
MVLHKNRQAIDSQILETVFIKIKSIFYKAKQTIFVVETRGEKIRRLILTHINYSDNQSCGTKYCDSSASLLTGSG